MIGIIGGTGVYQMDELQIAAVKEVTTPFGDPSSSIVVGILQGQDVAFLARHGVNHDLLPSEINYRGNVWALKAFGVRTILSVSAVGSLREDIRPERQGRRLHGRCTQAYTMRVRLKSESAGSCSRRRAAYS